MATTKGGSMSLVSELIERVESRGLKFVIGSAGRLVLKGDRAELTPALKTAIDAMKPDILAALGIVENDAPVPIEIAPVSPGRALPADARWQYLFPDGDVAAAWECIHLEKQPGWMRKATGDAWERIPGTTFERPDQQLGTNMPASMRWRFVEDHHGSHGPSIGDADGRGDGESPGE